ncbi:hypothetical protein [Profundibacterium mesophilum]|uniref:Integrase catalytic subunit n=1 Tax=Profundibacterium mesophilum KAUST100406-0324 TaxID=1037889 RepID=A0A921NNS2_9RHOB|nr:hypothetical protein [Profundibacterium mesophilum]KAF0674422.1 integrase catalytic subunit [Profundibacterium mesophilum KAUST100406-0324]
MFYRDFRASAQDESTPAEVDDPLVRFERAHELLSRSAEGKRIGEQEAEWLASYRQSAEFRQQMEMYEIYGDRMFAR